MLPIIKKKKKKIRDTLQGSKYTPCIATSRFDRVKNNLGLFLKIDSVVCALCVLAIFHFFLNK